ncbi:hypothetical protein [Collibacillus ludicampi]|nr:hypothetical protein [Collibacillus ludicampi]
MIRRDMIASVAAMSGDEERNRNYHLQNRLQDGILEKSLLRRSLFEN